VKRSPNPENHTMRRRLARRLGLDYLNKNPDLDLVQKLSNRWIINEKEEYILRKPRERGVHEEPHPESSIYETLIGFQVDSINAKLESVNDSLSFLNLRKQRVRNATNMNEGERSRAISEIESHQAVLVASMKSMQERYGQYKETEGFYAKKDLCFKIKNDYLLIQTSMRSERDEERGA